MVLFTAGQSQSPPPRTARVSRPPAPAVAGHRWPLHRRFSAGSRQTGPGAVAGRRARSRSHHTPVSSPGWHVCWGTHRRSAAWRHRRPARPGPGWSPDRSACPGVLPRARSPRCAGASPCQRTQPGDRLRQLTHRPVHDKLIPRCRYFHPDGGVTSTTLGDPRWWFVVHDKCPLVR